MKLDIKKDISVMGIDMEGEKKVLPQLHISAPKENKILVEDEDQQNSEKQPRFVIGCSDEDFEEDDVDEMRIIPPDGGWGWVVVAASFMCNVVVDGVIFTSGLLFPKLMEAFDVTNSQVAWISSLLGGFYLLVGPFVSSLANAYGFRIVCILGSVICAIGCGISYFATSIYFLYITFGVLAGMGFGLIYVPAVIATGFYFEKKRALATGIAVCGSGIGTFMMAPLTTHVLTTYEDWKLIFLVYGGIILTCIIFSLAFRPLSASTGKKVKRDEEELDVVGTPLLLRIKRARDRELAQCPSAMSMASYSRSPSVIDESYFPNGDIRTPPGSFNIAKALLDRHGNPMKRQSISGIIVSSPVTIIEETETSTDSSGSLNDSEETKDQEEETKKQENEKKDQEKETRDPDKVHENETNLSNNNKLLDNNKNETKKLSTAEDSSSLAPSAGETLQIPFQGQYKRIESAPTFLHSSREYQRRLSRQSRDQGSRPFYRDDIFYSGSLLRVPQYRSSETVELYHASVTHVPPAVIQDIDTVDSSSCKCCPVACTSVLQKIFDFTLLQSVTFIVLAVTGFMALMSLFVPFNFLPSYAKDLGVEETEVSFLLSLIGIFNTAGRIMAGWISDHPKVDALLVNNLALIIGGIATACLPFMKSLSLLYAYAVVFGLCVAAFASLRSILLVELLGLEKLTNAFGLLLLFQGLAATFGSPIAGMFADVTGGYRVSFYVFGGIFALSGLLCVPLRRIKKWEDDKIDEALRQEKYELYKTSDK